MNCWNSSFACTAPPPEGPTPPSSAYCLHRSLSTSSAQSANCRSATSPLESLPVLEEVWAEPSDAKRVPADRAAPAIPMPFRNERRSTTRCQRDSRSSVGVVTGVSAETIVGRFSFFTFLHSDLGIGFCNRLNVKLHNAGDIPQIEKYFPERSAHLHTSRRERLSPADKSIRLRLYFGSCST